MINISRICENPKNPDIAHLRQQVSMPGLLQRTEALVEKLGGARKANEFLKELDDVITRLQSVIHDPRALRTLSGFETFEPEPVKEKEPEKTNDSKPESTSGFETFEPEPVKEKEPEKTNDSKPESTNNTETPAEEPIEETVEKPVEETVENPVEETVENPVEETVENPVEETVEETTEEPAEEPVEKPVKGKTRKTKE